MVRNSSEKQNLNRRDFLRAGAAGAGAAGLSLAGLPELCASSPAADRNCILLFLVGGPSHIDTFDPKPNAPENIRGPFRPICTNVPGIQICEHLPLLAKQAERFVPPFVLLPWAIQNTGVNVSHGQTSGSLGDEFGPRLVPAGRSAWNRNS